MARKHRNKTLACPNCGTELREEYEFCPRCGTQLSYSSARFPGEKHFYAATLDDPAAYRPERHYFWAEHLPWLHLSDDLPRQ